MDDQKNKLIELGQCRKPHGVKGAFSFHLINQKDSTLSKGSRIMAFPLDKSSSVNSSGEEFIIDSISFGNKTIVTLKSIENRNQVEAMIPFSILIQRKDLPELEEDNYYLSDLIGLKVISDKGEAIGEVFEIGSNGVQDILRIKAKGQNIEVLLIEQFVKSIDWEEQKITIIVPELV
jgi:16S rRNA processing protein RimM